MEKNYHFLGLSIKKYLKHPKYFNQLGYFTGFFSFWSLPAKWYFFVGNDFLLLSDPTFFLTLFGDIPWELTWELNFVLLTGFSLKRYKKNFGPSSVISYIFKLACLLFISVLVKVNVENLSTFPGTYKFFSFLLTFIESGIINEEGKTFLDFITDAWGSSIASKCSKKAKASS